MFHIFFIRLANFGGVFLPLGVSTEKSYLYIRDQHVKKYPKNTFFENLCCIAKLYLHQANHLIYLTEFEKYNINQQIHYLILSLKLEIIPT